MLGRYYTDLPCQCRFQAKYAIRFGRMLTEIEKRRISTIVGID